MSRSNGRPEWLPVTREGLFWEFISFRGKWLGGIMRPQGSTEFLATKKCCNKFVHFSTIQGAARWVETTLHCVPCAQRITAEAIKFYGRSTSRSGKPQPL